MSKVPSSIVPDGRGRGAAADVPGNPVADRPAAGAAGTGMSGRSGQIRQTTTAEVCLDEGQATVSVLRGRKPDDLAANEVGCGQISLRCASMRRKIALDGPGIRGMSDYVLPDS